jgi:hypothetical protein
MALIDAVTEQFASHIPGFITRQRAVDGCNQLVSLFKLTVRSLRHAHFLVEIKQLFGCFLLFGLESLQPFIGAVRG